MDELLMQTTNHEVIRKWATHFFGTPYLSDAGENPDLCIGYHGGEGEGQVLITWEEWFTRFEKEQLLLYYKDELAADEDFPHYKLVHRGGDVDRHLQAPAEANRDKHINFLEKEEKVAG